MASNSAVLQAIEGAYPKLKPRLRKAARYVLNHPAEVALSSVRDVAAGANVSATTMVRLATELGFGNYNAFKEAFREPLRAGPGGYAAKASKQLSTLGRSGDDRHQSIVSGLRKGMDDLLAAVVAEDVNTAVRKILKARQLYVLGLRSMFSPAFYFYYLYRTLAPNAVLLENRMDMLIEEMGAIGAEDVLLVISFEPYALATVKSVEFARRTGAEVIALTDSKLGPLAAIAQQSFILPTAGSSFYQSLVPTMALLEMLISTIQIEQGDVAVDRIEAEFEKRASFGVYWRDKS